MGHAPGATWSWLLTDGRLGERPGGGRSPTNDGYHGLCSDGSRPRSDNPWEPAFGATRTSSSRGAHEGRRSVHTRRVRIAESVHRSVLAPRLPPARMALIPVRAPLVDREARGRRQSLGEVTSGSASSFQQRMGRLAWAGAIGLASTLSTRSPLAESSSAVAPATAPEAGPCGAEGALPSRLTTV